MLRSEDARNCSPFPGVGRANGLLVMLDHAMLVDDHPEDAR